MNTTIGSTFWQNEFLLRPDIHFLNFGSFGACPRAIFDDYQQWQRLLEFEPVQFIAFEGAGYLAASRQALGHYLGCAADDLVYVTNPTYAVNIVAKSLDLQPGDEILTTDLEYGACDKTWDFYCAKKGARYVRQAVRLPLMDEDTFLEEFFAGVTSRTKLIFISHITSTTALRLPVERLIARAKTIGLPVFVDGAHAPGQIRLNLSTLGADFYTGACHKWMLTAKGSSFLYAAPHVQEALEPLLVSWGYNSAKPGPSQFLDYHQMQGTRDFSAFLTIPRAIAYMEENDWTKRSADCRALVHTFGPELCALLGTQPLAPMDDRFIGQMLSCPIHTAEPEKLQRQLFEVYKIEIPVMVHGSAIYLRFSVQVFNRPESYRALLDAVHQLKTQGILKGA